MLSSSSLVRNLVRWDYLVTLLAASALMLGCSGGGGDGGLGGGGSDTTPPEISSVAPADSATDITLDATISATFDEAMDETTIDATTMTITPAVAGTVSYEASANRATFTPTGSLTASTTYTVTLTSGCEDAAGNAMTADYSWSFTTGATAVNEWTQVGGQVSPAGAESQDPTMMIASDTPAVGYRHASFEINLHTWNGLTWGTSAADPSGGGSNSSIYHMPAFCSNGDTIYMAYSRAGESGLGSAAFYDRVFAYQWTSASGYQILNGGDEVSRPYPSDFGADADEPAIGCYDSALPWVAWEELDGASSSPQDHAWAAEVTGGGTSVSRTTYVNRNNNDHPSGYTTDVRTVGILQDSAGCAYVAQWESHHDEQDQTDLYVSKTCGSGWTNIGGAVTDDWDYNNLSKPAMVEMGGQVYIAYTRANPSDYTQHVYVKTFNGSNWVDVGSNPVSAFSVSDHYDSGSPDLLVADGTLYLAWDESDQYDGPFVYVAQYDSGASSWVVDTTPLNVLAMRDALNPSLAYNANDGYLYVAFEEMVGGWPQIFVKRKRHIP